MGLQKNLPYISISFGVAIIFIFLNAFGLYDSIEHKLLDMRFISRGRIDTRSDIATLDIDSRTLQDEGRYPWSRDKHIPAIKTAEEHEMSALAFDQFFIEKSERELDYKKVNSINDSILTLDKIKSLFPDPDNDLAKAAKESENVYFAQTLFPQKGEKRPLKKLNQIKTTRLEALEKKGFYQSVDGKDYSTIIDFYDIDPPVEELILSSKGTYFFQTVADPDGVRRKYPLIGMYGNKLFPSISLALALDHYNVDFSAVNIIPGKRITISLKNPDEHGRKQVKIPIDKRGLMQVNWAGNWENDLGEHDFTHYPFWVLKKFQVNEYNNYVLSEIKKLRSGDPSLKKSIKALLKTSIRSNIAEKKSVINSVKRLVMADQMEKFILDYPVNKTGKDFFAKIKKKPNQAMLSTFNDIKNANTIADALIKNPSTTIHELLKNNNIVFSLPLPNYNFTSIKSLISDIRKKIKTIPDATERKSLKIFLTKTIQLERTFLIIKNLHAFSKVDEQRPLFFFPSKERITVGNVDKQTDRTIVPFEFYKKKLLYGLTAAGTHDLNPQPFSESYPMVGLHANALNTILSDNFIIKPSKLIIMFILIFIACLLSFGIQQLSPAIGGATILFLVSGYTFLCFWSFSNYNIWLDLFGPVSSIALGYLGITVYNYIQEEKNKQFLKSSFGTYISPELIDQMYESGQEPELGGEEGYHTAFFTDIQSFSAFSEKLSASDLVSLLNQYLTDMTNVLMENKGTLDKYIGDAIVAFYGAPLDLKDHELMACRTAIKMQERLAELRTAWQNEGTKWPEIVHHMQNRIGINTGQMVTGNMGSDSRMNYTMMGDTVNLAARLESSAKQYGVYIQIAESTYKAVSDKVVIRALDYVRVMGKTEPVKVFELISEVGQEPEPYKKILPAFHEGIQLYFSQDWAKATEAFKACNELEEMFPGRKTNPSRVYIERCDHFSKNAPGENWDGVWTHTSK